MTYLPQLDPRLAVPLGQVDGIVGVNKFGRNTDLGTSLEDVWEKGGIWPAPTTARTHDITSDAAADDGAPPGTGAQTIRVYGLTGWGAAEVSEDVIMNGVANVATGNQYVIIHRMKVLTFGTAGPNVGTITATAQVDATVTAQIDAGVGQTQMAIYGIPSIRDAYITNYYASMNRSGGASALVDVGVVVNPIPDVQLAGFLIKHTRGMQTTGSSDIDNPYNPYWQVEGPAIIKIEAVSSASGMDLSAGFDLYLVDNT